MLEGVAFGLRDNVRLLKEVGLPTPRQVRLSGGGARSPLWRQILADVLGVELVTVQTTEGAAYGAALLAGVGAGLWPSVETACTTTIRPDAVVEPTGETKGVYDAQYGRYRALYPILRPFYQE